MDPAIPVEILVEKELVREIGQLQGVLREHDDYTFDLQGKVNDLAEPATPEEQKVFDRLHRQLMNAIARGTAISQKLHILRTPSELERRVNQKLANQQSLRRLIMSETEAPAKPKKPTPADQGIPAQYLNEDGKAFRIGMDARLKSDLVNSVTGDITAEKPGASLHVFDEAEARRILDLRGWTGFLDRKLEINAQKETKKAEATVKREAAARERAEAKAASDAKKAADKAAAAEGGTASATTSGSKTEQARQQREAKAAAAAAGK